MNKTLNWEESVHSQEVHDTKGTHVIVDVWGVDFDKANDDELLLSLIKKVVKDASMTLVNISMKKFVPQGVTIIGLLEESHISVHTYPEKGYCAFDIFTCSDTCPANALYSNINEFLYPKQISHYIVKRGSEEGLTDGVGHTVGAIGVAHE